MRLWLILQIMNNPAWLNQTDCASLNCGLWTPIPPDLKLFTEVILMSTCRRSPAMPLDNHRKSICHNDRCIIINVCLATTTVVVQAIKIQQGGHK
jgi:hypothetical protein